MDEHWPVIEKPISLLKEHGIDVAVRNMSCTEDCVKVAATIAKILKDTESESKGKESAPGKLPILQTLTRRMPLEKTMKTTKIMRLPQC